MLGVPARPAFAPLQPGWHSEGHLSPWQRLEQLKVENEELQIEMRARRAKIQALEQKLLGLFEAIYRMEGKV
jgi:hypothetical protein